LDEDWWAQETMYLMAVQIRKEQFSGVVRAIQKHWQSFVQPSLQQSATAFAAKGIIQSASNVMQQK